MIHIIERNPLGCFKKQFCSKTLTSFSGCFTLLESKESASAFSSCSFDNFPALNSLIITHHCLESQRCHSAAQTRAMVRLTMFTSSDRQTPPFTNQWQQLYITRRLFFFFFYLKHKKRNDSNALGHDWGEHAAYFCEDLLLLVWNLWKRNTSFHDATQAVFSACVRNWTEKMILSFYIDLYLCWREKSERV